MERGKEEVWWRGSNRNAQREEEGEEERGEGEGERATLNMRIVSKLSTFSCHHCLMAGVCTFRNSGGTWDRHTGRQTDRQTDRQTNRQTVTHLK